MTTHVLILCTHNSARSVLSECMLNHWAAKLGLDVRDELWAPNGYLHAGTVITLADTLCGYGCVANLPDGASGFTTIEVKSNFLGTATEGSLTCKATLIHGGRTTQVWDAPVVHEQTGKTIALFRCTQMVLWPK